MDRNYYTVGREMLCPFELFPDQGAVQLFYNVGMRYFDPVCAISVVQYGYFEAFLFYYKWMFPMGNLAVFINTGKRYTHLPEQLQGAFEPAGTFVGRVVVGCKEEVDARPVCLLCKG